MLYEINFLVLQSKTAELEKIRKETKKFIESYGAKITEEKEYLKRKLAYEIQHENYGFFTVLRFEFKKGTNLDELKVKLNQRNEVARYIIVKADELPSLEEQDTKKLEKIHTGKKSIKSEDVEKALAEQKRAEKETVTEEVEEKKEKEVKEETVEVEEKKAEKKESKEKPKTAKESSEKENDTETKKPEKKKPAKKTEKKNSPSEEKEEKDDDISLDELDKKLDEILNG